MDYIIERKKTSDLATSIVDGRYEEQKMRLLDCGLSRPIYLVEGSLSNQDTLPVSSLKTALVSTQVAGFKVGGGCSRMPSPSAVFMCFGWTGSAFALPTPCRQSSIFSSG
jgi:ERCC4-type nuclease